MASTQLVANPAPLGLAGFGLTTFVLSMYNAGVAVGYGAPNNVVTGLALFYGGLAQLLAGMWEFKAVNAFGATAFTSFGAFWMSYAVILIPGFGVTEAAYTRNELHEALAIYLLAWAIFTFILFLCSLRQSLAFIALFGMLTITFLLLSIGNFRSHQLEPFTKAGGWTGLVTAAVSFYIVLAELATKENTFFTLPLGKINTRIAISNRSLMN